MEDRVRQEGEVVTEQKRRGRPSMKQIDNSVKEVTKTVEKKDFIPFTTEDELPMYSVDGKGKFKKIGGYRYFLQALPQGGYKFMAIYRKHSSIATRMVKTLKTNMRNKIKDIKFYKDLIASGVPIRPPVIN